MKVLPIEKTIMIIGHLTKGLDALIHFELEMLSIFCMSWINNVQKY